MQLIFSFVILGEDFLGAEFSTKVDVAQCLGQTAGVPGGPAGDVAYVCRCGYQLVGNK